MPLACDRCPLAVLRLATGLATPRTSLLLYNLHALLKSHKSMISSNSQQTLSHKGVGFFRNVIRLRILSWSSGGRLFHAAGQATANARGPMVTVFVAGMNRSPDAAERRCDRPAIELTGIQYLDKYEGADPSMHRRARTHSLKRARSEISSQWS